MISSIRAAQRIDSRGKPTVQVTVATDKGSHNLAKSHGMAYIYRNYES
jgi:enolase